MISERRSLSLLQSCRSSGKRERSIDSHQKIFNLRLSERLMPAEGWRAALVLPLLICPIYLDKRSCTLAHPLRLSSHLEVRRKHRPEGEEIRTIREERGSEGSRSSWTGKICLLKQPRTYPSMRLERAKQSCRNGLLKCLAAGSRRHIQGFFPSSPVRGVVHASSNYHA